jgi:DNA-binding beta-propeller fold protein YncE
VEKPPALEAQKVGCVSELEHAFSFGSSGTMPGQFRFPSSIRVDQFDNMLVADTGNNRIQKFDASGRFLMEFGAAGSSDGSLNQPTDCVENGLRIYVVDSVKRRIVEYDSEGRFLSVCVSGESLADRFSAFEPKKIAFSPTGYVFVSDTDADALVVFSRFWDPVSVVGGFGAGEGRFRNPGGLTVDSRGGVLVCDTGNDRLQALSSTGNFVMGIPVCGGLPGCEPTDVAMGPRGFLYVADSGLGRVMVLDASGAVKCEVDAASGKHLFHPRSLAISPKGLLYVLDGGSDEVHVFKTSGASSAED